MFFLTEMLKQWTYTYNNSTIKHKYIGKYEHLNGSSISLTLKKVCYRFNL